MARNDGMNVEIALSCPAKAWEIEYLFLQNAQKYVVCLRPRTGKFVIYQRVSVSTGGCEAIIHPKAPHLFLCLHDRVYDSCPLTWTCDSLESRPDQVGTSILVVAVDKHDRPAQFGSYVKGQSCLSGAGRTGEMD